MTLTVESADANSVKLRLDGATLLATGPDPAKAKRGYDAALLGYIEYDRAKDRLTRFDLVATGDHWGEGRFTGGARPGRKPMGVAFELARGDKPADAVPPQAAGAGGVLRREVRDRPPVFMFVVRAPAHILLPRMGAGRSPH